MGFAILYPVHRWLNNNGTPLALGRIYTYIEDSGTAQPAYADSTATTSHGDYVQLDQYGRGAFYLDASLPPYKLIVKDADGVTVDTLDNVNTNLQGSSFSGITITNSEIVSPTITTPSWVANTIGMPGEVYLGSMNVASNVCEDIDILSSGYTNFKIVIDAKGMTTASDSADLILQIYGTSYITSGYVTLCNGFNTDGTAIAKYATNNAGFVLMPSTTVGGDDAIIYGGVLYLSCYRANAVITIEGVLNGIYSGIKHATVTVSGYLDAAGTAVAGLKFLASAGNLGGAISNTGVAHVFGIPGA